MSKDEKCTCKACKNTVFDCQICGAFVAVVVVVCLSYLLGSLSKDDIDKQLERHLKMQFCVSAIISQLLKVITLAKCALTILELNVNQRFRNKKTKLSICYTIYSGRPRNCKSHFMSWKEREHLGMYKSEKCKCKACVTTVFHCQICKLLTFILPPYSWWMVKLPIVEGEQRWYQTCQLAVGKITRYFRESQILLHNNTFLSKSYLS